ncbi:MAG TPA: IS200/IS605 family transposase [Bacteroidales bacterium]|jgi:REP element-mobilizing transposase RayT|nr:IS200/IS605 family transposase [Bacteroidales bacterium]
MSSYRQHLYHIVIRTKDSRPTIKLKYSEDIYSYITGLTKQKNSHLYRINGIENHIHILTDIHPSIAPADFVKDIKVASSMWVKKSGLHPSFYGWSEGYGSFTCSFRDIDTIIEYIKNQRIHHSKISFEDEYRALLIEAGIDFDGRYFP